MPSLSHSTRTLERLNQSNTSKHWLPTQSSTVLYNWHTLHMHAYARIGHTSLARNWWGGRRRGGTPNTHSWWHRTVQVVQGVGDEHWSWLNVVQWNKSDYYFSLLNQPNSTTRTTTTATCCQDTSTSLHSLTLPAHARKANQRQSLFVWHAHCDCCSPVIAKKIGCCLFVFSWFFSFCFVLCWMCSFIHTSDSCS